MGNKKLSSRESVTRLVWSLLFSVAGLAICILGFQFASGLSAFLSLSAKTTGHVEHWFVESGGPSKYFIAAEYSFQCEEEQMLGKTFFQKPICPNEFSAQKLIEKYAKKPWAVYYSKKNPNISSLVKKFPLKRFFHFLISVGIFFYFFWLKESSAAKYQKI